MAAIDKFNTQLQEIYQSKCALLIPYQKYALSKLAQTLLGTLSGDHQGEDCTLLATTSCTSPAAERRRATASWWDSPTSDCPLIMRSSSPAVSLPSLRKQSGNVELQGGPSLVPGSGGAQWDVEVWTTGDLADAKLALIGAVLFAKRSGSERCPQEIIVTYRAISPPLQG